MPLPNPRPDAIARLSIRVGRRHVGRLKYSTKGTIASTPWLIAGSFTKDEAVEP